MFKRRYFAEWRVIAHQPSWQVLTTWFLAGLWAGILLRQLSL